MTGETDLRRLLSTMSPSLQEDEFVFTSFNNAAYGDHPELSPIASFKESEGLTLVIPRLQADMYQIQYEASFKCITLKIHSSLEAVGLTAAFSKILTEHGISANVLAGFFHDHIFVQTELADQAMLALKELSNQSL